MAADDPGTASVAVTWDPARPRIMVVACSDGRLQEATDEFLSRHLNIHHYDRLYLPGGAGALSASGREYFRALQLQRECKYLVGVHGVERLFAMFHGPAPDGPPEAMCADYRRKFAWATTQALLTQQEQDARQLLAYRWDWAGPARVHIYRCEVGADGAIRFVTLHADPDTGMAHPSGG